MKFDFLRRVPSDHRVSLSDRSKYQIAFSSLLVSLHLMHLREAEGCQSKENVDITMYSTWLADGGFHDEIECHSEFNIELKNKIEITVTELFEEFLQFCLGHIENRRQVHEIRNFLEKKFDLSRIWTAEIELVEHLVHDLRKQVVNHATEFRIQKRFGK